MKGIKYNLDERLDAISSIHFIDDLTFPCSILEITFAVGDDLEFSPDDGVQFNQCVWQFQSYDKVPTTQAIQYTAFALLKGSLSEPRRTLRTSADVLSYGFVPAVGRYSNVKFKTPIKGDTLAVLLRQLQFQSLEENINSLSSSLCLSLTTQGFISSPWKTLVRSSQKFNQDTGLLRPEVYLANDESYWKYEHTPIPLSEKQLSYFKRLFGNKVLLKSNMCLRVGTAFSFDLNGLGVTTSKKYLLIRQEFEHQSTGDGLVYKQTFAEVL